MSPVNLFYFSSLVFKRGAKVVPKSGLLFLMWLPGTFCSSSLIARLSWMDARGRLETFKP